MSAADRVAVWLDDDHELRIPDTPWGRALHADLREVLAASSHNEWACKGNQRLYAEAAAERDRLRATVARVEALADRLAQIHNRLHGDVEINRQEHRRGERDLARWLHAALRAALAGESDGQ